MMFRMSTLMQTYRLKHLRNTPVCLLVSVLLKPLAKDKSGKSILWWSVC